jgi:hypothetical protein
MCSEMEMAALSSRFWRCWRSRRVIPCHERLEQRVIDAMLSAMKIL